MNRILIIAAISLLLISCRKEYSYEGEPQTQPFQEDYFIANESGGLNFFLFSNGTQISVNVYHDLTQVPVNEANKYYEYEVGAGDLQDDIIYTIELQYHVVPAQGTFDFMVESFTAIQGNKTFLISSIPVSISDAGTEKKFLKMRKKYNRYSFSQY